MTTVSLRLPESLHKMARELAQAEGVSINQLITLALAEKIAALTTETYLEERAARADKQAFLAAIDKVSNEEPEEVEDRL